MIKNHRGFTLIEVIVVVGIMGVVAGGMSSLLLLQQKGQSGLRFRTEVENMQSEIRQTLGNSLACSATVGPIALAPATTYNLNDVKNVAGGVSILKNTPLNDRAVIISDIKMTDYADTVAPAGAARLTVTYTSPVEVLGPSTLVRTFNLATTKDGLGKLASCNVAATGGGGGGGSGNLWVPAIVNPNNISYLLGDVGIGTSDPFQTVYSAGAYTGLDIQRDGHGATLRLSSSNENTRHTFIEGVATRGTVASPAPILPGDTMLSIKGVGFHGAGFYAARAAFIDMEVDGPTTNNIPARIVMGTATAPAGNAVERMRIDSSGNVGIGTSSPGSKLEVNGSSDLNGSIKLGAYGVSYYGGNGACKILEQAITVTPATYTCDGVPPSVEVVVTCSGTQAMTTPTGSSVYCRASGVGSQVICNTPVANSVSMDWVCSWVFLPSPS